jgi:hypothetical protein
LASITIVFGLLMVVLGVAGYFLTGRQSITALIPVTPGVVWVVLGALARNERLRKHAMHAAAALSLVGFLAMARAIVALVRMQMGVMPERPAAVTSQALLGILFLVFLILCVRSFIAARRSRLAGTTGPTV